MRGDYLSIKLVSRKRKEKGGAGLVPEGWEARLSAGGRHTTHRGQSQQCRGEWSRGPLTPPFLPRVEPRQQLLAPSGALSPSLRCSAASLVSWESEMKHCSSGRGKLFCSRQPGRGKWGGAWGHREGWERFQSLCHRPLVPRKFLDPSPTRATINFMILAESWLFWAPQSVHL